MQTALIFIIVGLASAYLLRNFYRSLQNNSDSQCGCSGCNSCPKENNCDETSLETMRIVKK